jgi:hypothetical protein
MKNMENWIIGIILAGVLLGATLSPTIAASNSLRHFTVELTSPKVTQRTTVTLSETDAQKVQDILDNVNGRLDNATSTEEQYQVYTSTVAQLYQYRVFGDLTLAQAQQLVTYWYRAGPHDQRNVAAQYSINKNAFCLVSGHTGYTYTGHRFTNWMQAGGAIILMIGIILSMPPFYPPHSATRPLLTLLGLLLTAVGFMTYSLGVALANRADITPIAVGDIFGIGFYYGTPDDIWYAPGWVHTLGLLGDRNWSGELRGNLPGMFPYDLLIITYQAIWGFSGIKIWLNEDGSEKSYLGSALLVGLDEKG